MDFSKGGLIAPRAGFQKSILGHAPIWGFGGVMPPNRKLLGGRVILKKLSPNFFSKINSDCISMLLFPEICPKFLEWRLRRQILGLRPQNLAPNPKISAGGGRFASYRSIYGRINPPFSPPQSFEKKIYNLFFKNVIVKTSNIGL